MTTKKSRSKPESRIDDIVAEDNRQNIIKQNRETEKHQAEMGLLRTFTGLLDAAARFLAQRGR